MICGSTMAFHMRKLFLVSFSCDGAPRDMAWVLLDEGAKVDEEAREVVSALMVLDWVEAVVMARFG